MTEAPLTPRHRISRRLPGYDYSQDGAYFITIVTESRELLFEDGALKSAAEQNWLWLGEQCDYVRLDEFVVMPNHLHGIIFIDGLTRVVADRPEGSSLPRKSIGRLIGVFKTASTQAINARRLTRGVKVWQRNYYDYVVRDDDDLNRIRQYIMDNPRRWFEDPENPDFIATRQSD